MKITIINTQLKSSDVDVKKLITEAFIAGENRANYYAKISNPHLDNFWARRYPDLQEYLKSKGIS